MIYIYCMCTISIWKYIIIYMSISFNKKSAIISQPSKDWNFFPSNWARPAGSLRVIRTAPWRDLLGKLTKSPWTCWSEHLWRFICFPHVRFQKMHVNMCMTMYKNIYNTCMHDMGVHVWDTENIVPGGRDPRRITIKLSINAMIFLQKMVTWSSGKSPHSFPISKCRHSETCGTWDIWLIDRSC